MAEHDHHHDHHAAPGNALRAAAVLTIAFAVVEALGGWWTGSLALLSDAGHMLTDAVALAMSLFAIWIRERPATPRRTYGYQRTDVLVALGRRSSDCIPYLESALKIGEELGDRGAQVDMLDRLTVLSVHQLRFDVARSPSLADDVRTRLMALAGGRLSKDGVLIILARTHRTQERNRADARKRPFDLIRRAATPPKPRRPTKPTFASKRRRREAKTMRAKLKRNRSKLQDD